MGEQSIPVQQRAALLEARAEKKGFVGRTLADLEEEIGLAGGKLCFFVCLGWWHSMKTQQQGYWHLPRLWSLHMVLCFYLILLSREETTHILALSQEKLHRHM